MQLGQIDYDDLEPCGVTVTLGKGEKKKTYILREATADVAVKYKNRNLAAVRMQDGEVVGVGDQAEADLYLVASCLCETPPDRPDQILVDKWGRSVTVPPDTIRGWKDAVFKSLLAKVKELTPSLDEAPDEKTLHKQINVLTRQLVKLREAKTDPEASAKKDVSATSDTSASP